jgi:hypothetical protein
MPRASVQQDDLGYRPSLDRHLHIHAGSLGHEAQLSQKVDAFRGAAVERDLRRRGVKDQQLGIVASRECERMREHVLVPIVDRDRTEHT